MNESELAAEVEMLTRQNADLNSAFESIRDSVLHQRHQLEGYEIDIDIINGVLGIIDDARPTNPGYDLLTKEQGKLLAEAVNFALSQCDRELWETCTDEWCPIPKAVALIKQLGLTKKG